MEKNQNYSYQKCYIKRYTMTSGKEDGLKVIELDNGTYRALLNESKGLDIMQVFYKGENISFVSKNGFTKRELSFADRFEGGMLYTCGLDAIGRREGFDLHGTYHNLPAKVTNISQNDKELKVVAEMEFTSLFGQNLLMIREIILPVNGSSLRLNDKLINLGTKEENYCVLYHVNLGYPFLEEGVKIEVDANNVTPCTEYAKENFNDRSVFPAPIANEDERCYFIENNKNVISATNTRSGKKFILTYSKETLPGLVEWVSLSIGDYALGLEPATSYLNEGFEYRKIKPGQEVDFYLNLEIKEI